LRHRPKITRVSNASAPAAERRRALVGPGLELDRFDAELARALRLVAVPVLDDALGFEAIGEELSG